MREILEEKPTQSGGVGRFLGVALVAGALGVIAGANLFPVVETKVVEKRVEVPVDVIKYVDRRVEVPVDRVVDRVVTRYVGATDLGVGSFSGRAGHWNQVKPGMNQRQVFDVLGQPNGQPEVLGHSILYRWGSGHVIFGSFADGRLVEQVLPP
jgi:hypothetical protein